jgi:hypothetical protein
VIRLDRELEEEAARERRERARGFRSNAWTLKVGEREAAPVCVWGGGGMFMLVLCSDEYLAQIHRVPCTDPQKRLPIASTPVPQPSTRIFALGGIEERRFLRRRRPRFEPGQYTVPKGSAPLRERGDKGLAWVNEGRCG